MSYVLVDRATCRLLQQNLVVYLQNKWSFLKNFFINDKNENMDVLHKTLIKLK